jgi:hypothetical protein
LPRFLSLVMTETKVFIVIILTINMIIIMISIISSNIIISYYRWCWVLCSFAFAGIAL